MESLFGEDFEIKRPPIKEIVKSLTKKEPEIDTEKLLKSKKISLLERLAIINERVLHVLGKQRDNVVVIKSKEALQEYINQACKTVRIAVDTETNNSLDPITCKLMGLCLYYPGGKQAYVPINHRDPTTKVRLSWQLTEQDCKEALQQIIDSKKLIIMHNGKFDYEVLKCTCGIAVRPDWDTMIAARLLNENELAGLKWQYINKIDKSQEKYDIEKLFEKVAYADVDPEIFALYAATDAFLTDKLYEIQAVELAKPDYDAHLDMTGTRMLPGIRWLFYNIEMPIVVITAEMELTGVCVDETFGEKLKIKYTAQLEELDTKINAILKSISPIIAKWRLDPANAAHTHVYVAKKTKMSQAKIEQQYPEIDSEGNRYKLGKSKTEQLEEDINLASPTQLAILFYDVLGINLDNSNRKTGKDELKSIKELLAQYLPKIEDFDESDYFDEDGNLTELEDIEVKGADPLNDVKKGFAAELANLLLKRRELAKLITTYIDVIPELAKHWPDGRIRFHLQSLGTNTGRYSSGGKWHWLDENENDRTVSGINIQNIPSRGSGKICRLLFKATTTAKLVEETDDSYFIIPEISEVETPAGYFYCKDLKCGDIILVENEKVSLKTVEYDSSSKTYILGV